MKVLLLTPIEELGDIYKQLIEFEFENVEVFVAFNIQECYDFSKKLKFDAY